VLPSELLGDEDLSSYERYILNIKIAREGFAEDKKEYERQKLKRKK
jgi:hypothetical protein